MLWQCSQKYDYRNKLYMEITVIKNENADTPIIF